MNDTNLRSALNRSHDHLKSKRRSENNSHFEQAAQTVKNRDQIILEAYQNQQRTSNLDKALSEQNKPQTIKNKHQLSLETGPPQKRSYHINILQSPLLNFSGYPSSILKRLSSRATTTDKAYRRRDSLHRINEDSNQNDVFINAGADNALLPLSTGKD